MEFLDSKWLLMLVFLAGVVYLTPWISVRLTDLMGLPYRGVYVLVILFLTLGIIAIFQATVGINIYQGMITLLVIAVTILITLLKERKL